jgi:hygromycin-B 7''-O-kinase
MPEFSNRLGHISTEQFQAALTRLHLGDFVEAEAIPFGLFGQNVFLTSTQGKFVLRGAPHYPWQFPTEQFFVDQLHARTQAPVPYPYLLEPSTDIFGWSFVIMPRMPGLQLHHKLAAARLALKDRLEIAVALARMLVEVQNLTWVVPGKFDPQTGDVMPFDKPYHEWVIENIHEKAAAAQGYNDHTTASDLDWIKSVIDASRSFLVPAGGTCVVLGDYGAHNSSVVRSEGAWHVSGIFDLMTAHFGDGQADLSVQVRNYLKKDDGLAETFIDEYLRLKPRPVGFVEQQRLYMLDLMLSFWRHWQKHQGSVPGEQIGLTFEQYARPSVEFWDKYLA